MTTVGVHEAKTHLSQLLQRAVAGEDIVIARAGKPMARLVPIEPEKPPPRTLGIFEQEWRDAGYVWDQEAWDAADREIEAEFEASANEPLDPRER